MRFHTLGAAVLTLTLNVVKCQSGGAEKEDETRPYEFGFNIEGYQHRHEKKDDKGIIMGEFGFITGDGVYHITVYATDENGNFKILKMKNVYIGLPTEKTPSEPPGISEGIPVKVTEIMTNQLEDKKPEGMPGCGGCIIPTKPQLEMNGKPSPIAGMMVSMGGGKPAQEFKPSPSKKPLKPLVKPIMLIEKPMVPLPKPMVPAPFSMTSTGVDTEDIFPSTVGSTQTITDNFEESTMTSPLTTELMMIEEPVKGSPPMNFNMVDSPDNETPMSNIDTVKPIKDHENPTSAIPPQPMLTQQELLGMLYKFNYSLSYHGHHEMGNKKGDKTGGYFTNGRDGVGVNVEYKANEFGYQPNITFKKLSEKETPKKETEKELNQLHGYEFKWFYSR